MRQGLHGSSAASRVVVLDGEVEAAIAATARRVEERRLLENYFTVEELLTLGAELEEAQQLHKDTLRAAADRGVRAARARVKREEREQEEREARELEEARARGMASRAPLDRAVNEAIDRVVVRRKAEKEAERREEALRNEAKGTQAAREERMAALVAAAKKRLYDRIVQEKEREIKELASLVELQTNSLDSLRIVKHLDPSGLLIGGFVASSHQGQSLVLSKELSAEERAKKAVAIEARSKARPPVAPLITSKKDQKRLARLLDGL